MAKLGFDIEEHRQDLQRRMERTEDTELKRKANEIAADNVKTAHRALIVSVVATGVSLVALVVAIIVAIVK